MEFRSEIPSQTKIKTKTQPPFLKESNYMVKFYGYLEERQHIISTEKTTTTLFTQDPAETHLTQAVSINNKIINLEKNPKLLGITVLLSRLSTT